MPRFRPFRGDINFIGLEPDERSSKDLETSAEASEFRSYRIIPVGAWSRDEKVEIAFTRKPMCSSHFEPNTTFLNQFPDAKRFDVVGSGAVDCQTIDGIFVGVESSVDFIKLDLEGGELEVIRGGDRILRTCLGLHVEVCFHQLRQGQPLFGEIAAYLEKRNIDFIDFVALIRWERDSFRGAGQAVIADALFLRPPEGVAAALASGVLAAEKAKSYIAILFIYERFDLARRFMNLLSTLPAIADEKYLRSVGAILEKRKRSFDARFAILRTIGSAMAYSAAPNSSVHWLY